MREPPARKLDSLIDRSIVRRVGIGLNIAVRLSILYFLAEVMLNQEDPRFAGKAIPVRNLIIVLTFSSLFPVLRLIGRLGLGRGKPYPVWIDNLYLSIFWLDMAGNSFNLYDTYYYFDLIPHFHSSGALAVVLRSFGLPHLSAFGMANVVHMGLEAQEHYTDVLFGTHNVRGLSDTVNDLTVGLAGTAIYGSLRAGYERLRSP